MAGRTWKIGLSLVPAIVCLMCVLGCCIARKLPASYSEELVFKEMDRIAKIRKR